MAYRLNFHPEAETEFEEAIGWYQEQQAGLEQIFFEEYLAVENRLTNNPLQFPTVFENIRRANFARFPYSLFFEIEQKSVFIYAIFHQSRNPGEWERRL